MRSSQRKRREGVVIEFRPLPVRRCMTTLALHRKIELAVIGIGGLFEIRKVAIRTIHRCSGKTPADVASRA